MIRSARPPLGLAFALPILAIAGCAGAVAPPAAPPTTGAPIEFVENDYEAARARAKRENRPLFVDTWAAWCHSCQSLRAYVFPAKEVRAVRDRAVWLSIDSELDANEPFMKRFPTPSLPTLWVIDPRSEVALVKWTGAPTPTELATMIDDAAHAYASGEPVGVEAALMRADRLATEGKIDAAVSAYRDVVATAPASWPKRARAFDALTANLDAEGAYEECFDTAKRAAAELPEGTSRANVIESGLSCGEHLVKDDARRTEVEAFAKSAIAWANDTRSPVMADDRSALFEAAVSALDGLGEKAPAHAAAEQWASYLDGEAARAHSAAERAVFDAHRVNAYIELGVPERAIPILEQTMKDAPSDFNPHARLALAYKAMKRYAEAEAAIDRAIALGYGPRRARLFMRKAEIELGKGDIAAARGALEKARDIAVTDPVAKLKPSLLREIDSELHKLP